MLDRDQNSLYFLNHNRCRICLLSDDEIKKEILNVCACRGTCGLLHLDCLEIWIKTNGRITCEICSQPYRLVRQPLYSTLSSIPAFVSQNAFYKWVLLYLAFAATVITAFVLHVTNRQHYPLQDYTILIFTIFTFFLISVMSSAFKDWSKWHREQYRLSIDSNIDQKYKKSKYKN